MKQEILSKQTGPLLILLNVETAHINWMADKLAGGGLFVDVGAATGAATIPIALRFGAGLVDIVAFEPAKNAMNLLQKTCQKNKISSVQFINKAVSDCSGQVKFVEFDHDPSGNCPFLPEVSSITHKTLSTDNSNQHIVDCTTLDSFFTEGDLVMLIVGKTVVIKIDVEGFEEHVLNGGGKFIEMVRPALSIDIHNNINGMEGTTEEACRRILGGHGYNFVNLGHVLLCSP